MTSPPPGNPPGPAWTRARLQRVMVLRFGAAADGRSPDTAAAAAAMGVSRRTVQRWLQTGHGRAVAPIPPARLAQLVDLLTPDPATLGREEQQARYAETAIAGLALPRGRGVKPAWEKQRWLEPHRVMVVQIRWGQLSIRQLATAREDPARLREVTRRGEVVDQALVPTRLHATALTHQVLRDVAPWRFQAHPDQVAQGHTQAWLADATTPRTHLDARAADLEAERRRAGRDGAVTRRGRRAPS